jgi:hypothetical protein
MKTRLEREGQTIMKTKRIPPWAMMILCLILMQMADTASAQPLDVNVLAGQWARIDGNYALRVRDVMPDGTAEVGYFNPGKIHVAESRITRQDGRLKLFVKLQDKGYPGSTYTLYYYTEKDALAGAYYQAVTGRTYDVIFVRTSPKE